MRLGVVKDSFKSNKIISMFYINIGILLKLRKWRLIKRIVGNYALILLANKRLLRSVDFAPSYACNCDCKHCFAAGLNDRNREVMTHQDYHNVALQAKKLGAIHFALQGGEPLLLQDLGAIVRAIGADDSFISITTNGLLLSEKRAKDLKSIGVDMITVSIDSGIAAEHDAFRNMPGLFQKALDGIRHSLSAGLIVTVNTTVTHQNLASGGFRKIVEICDDLHVKLNLIYPAASGKWAFDRSHMLTDQDKTSVRAITAGRKFIRRDLDANYTRYGCGAVKEMIYISAFGDVMPCSYIHVSLGNIRKDPLAACIAKCLSIPVISDYAPVCPPMEDMTFITTVMANIAGAKKMPADIDEVIRSRKAEMPDVRRNEKI